MKNRYRVISSRASVIGCALVIAAACSIDDRSPMDGALAGQDDATDMSDNAGAASQMPSSSPDDPVDAMGDDPGEGAPDTEMPTAVGEPSNAGVPLDMNAGVPPDMDEPPAGSAGGAPPNAATGTSCVGDPLPAADPTNPGQFQVTTETNVGPMAGALPDLVHGNMQPQFNIYRPTDLEGGFCHPIITWGNGHSDQPRTYEVLLKQLASHGFVVIASLSSIVSQGDPPPMIAGVNWLIEQNDDPTSEFYHHLDTTHIGATGHSEGGVATTNAGSDPNVFTIATIAGASGTPNVHGPALFQCGGEDTQFPCSRIMPAFDAVNDQPVMLLVNIAATHGSWIGSIRDPFMQAVTGWMRLHLMGDTALRNMFFGPDCRFCEDNRVQVMRKMMDQ